MRKASHIGSEIPEHFCLFQTEDTTKTLSAHNHSSITSKIMWTAGLPGHRRTYWVSRAWKISFSSLVVLWSPRGLPLHSPTTLRTRKSLWRAERSITVELVLFGPIFGEVYYITIVVSSQSVPPAASSLHGLIFFFVVPWKSEFYHGSGSMCLRQGISSNVRPSPDQVMN